MKNKSILRSVSIILILLLIGYISYTFFLRDIYLNNLTRTEKISSLKSSRILHLGKHSSQKEISSFELEIKGTTNHNLSFFYGNGMNSGLKQIMLKQGKIDFADVGDYYEDSIIIYFPSDPSWKGDLSIDYRFIH